MHRLLLEAGIGQIADHKDGDGLNNRRDNIRLCTYQQNNQNIGVPKGNNPYKGVNLDTRTGTWRARIGIDFKRVSLGYHSTPEAAARAYDAAARRLFGEFARTNF